MTREEEIRNAIDTIFPIPPCEKGRRYGQSLMATGFEAGVKWADNHSKSPWISVKDDLPCNNSYLTSSVCTDDVIVYECGKIYNSYMRMDVNNEWYWAKGKPQYWMPIPELPKE